MHYYSFNPKDYMSKTSFLEPMEDLAYRRMLDHCYLTELPLPDNVDEIAMLIRMRTHCESIKVVLHYFFELTPQGYICDRVSRELIAYHSKSSKAKASAEARWDKHRNKIKDIERGETQCESNANALSVECESNANKEQRTKNKEQIESVFLFWKETFKKNDRTKLQGVRESKIKARLKEGYTVEDIKKAIVNVSQSKYHTENGYTDIELICRDQVKLDKFIGSSESGSTQTEAGYGEQQNKPVRKAVAVKKNYLGVEL